MDLRNRDTRAAAATPIRVYLKDPDTNEPLGPDVWIDVTGKDGDRYQSALRKANDVRMRASQRKRNPDPIMTADIQNDERLALAAATTGWGPGMELDGQKIEWSAADAAAIFEEFPWIREQVDGAASDRGLFLKASNDSSPKPSEPSRQEN